MRPALCLLSFLIPLAGCAARSDVQIVIPGEGTVYASRAPDWAGCQQWGTYLNQRGEPRPLWVCPPRPKD